MPIQVEQQPKEELAKGLFQPLPLIAPTRQDSTEPTSRAHLFTMALPAGKGQSVMIEVT
jgi:hypothetical protein